jgi:four helix bundle protein
MSEQRWRLQAGKAGAEDEEPVEPSAGQASRSEGERRAGSSNVARLPEPTRGRAVDEGELPYQRLDVYLVAKELARRVHRMKINDRELRDQATRAAKSTFLRLSEGLPNEGAAMRRKYFTEARSSLHEVLAAVDLAATVEAARETEAEAVHALGVRLKRMLRALLH